MTGKTKGSGQIGSYLTLRRAIGWIGIFLPFVLYTGNLILFRERLIRPSISDYYFSGMRDVMVGALCAVALFLVFYQGYADDRYGRWDKWTTNVAGLAAVGIAWFPESCGRLECFSGRVHFICGSVFFLVLAFISFFLFTRTRDGKPPKGRKRIRNMVYRLCGILIFLCVAMMGLYFALLNDSTQRSGFVFFSESLALLAFGTSWLTKGRLFHRPRDCEQQTDR